MSFNTTQRSFTVQVRMFLKCTAHTSRNCPISSLWKMTRLILTYCPSRSAGDRRANGGGNLIFSFGYCNRGFDFGKTKATQRCFNRLLHLQRERSICKRGSSFNIARVYNRNQFILLGAKRSNWPALSTFQTPVLKDCNLMYGIIPAFYW